MRFAIKKEKNEKDPGHLYSSPWLKAECYQAMNSIAELYPLCVRGASEHLALYSFQKGLNLISSHMLKNSWICLQFPLPLLGVT